MAILEKFREVAQTTFSDYNSKGQKLVTKYLTTVEKEPFIEI